MATENVGDLSVQLRADLNDFLKGMDGVRREIKKTAGGLDRGAKSVKSFENSFNGVKKSLGPTLSSLKKVQSAITQIAGFAFAGAVGGQLVSLAKDAIGAADAVGKTASRVGVSVEALQELEFAAERTSGTSEGLANILQRLNRKVGDVAGGNKEAAKAFAALGVDVKDSGGNLKDTETVVLEISDALKKAGDPTRDMSKLVKLLDTEAGRFIDTFRLGSEALDEFGKQARDAGIFTKDMADEAAILNDRIDVASGTLKKQFQVALLSVGPLVADLTERLADLLKKFSELIALPIKNLFGEQASWDIAVKRISDIQKELTGLGDELAKIENRSGATNKLWDTFAPGFVEGRVKTLKGQVAALRQEQSELNTSLTRLSPAVKAVADDLNDLPSPLSKTGDTADAAKRALDSLRKSMGAQAQTLRDQVATFGLSARAVVAYQFAQDSANPATRDLAAAIRDESLALIELTEAQDAAAAKEEAMAVVLESSLDLKQQLTDAAEDMAEAQQDGVESLQAELAALADENAVLQLVAAGLVEVGDESRVLAGWQLEAEVAALKMTAASEEEKAELAALEQQISNLINANAALTQSNQTASDSFLESIFGASGSSIDFGAVAGDLVLDFSRQFSRSVKGLAGVGSGLGAELGSSILGGIGTYFGGPLGGIAGDLIGGLLGGLFDDLFAPGRIRSELKDIEKWFEETTGLLAHATFPREHAEAFEELENSLHAVGVEYANLSEGGLGTIKRVANLATAAMVRHNMTLEDGQELAVELAQSMGLDLAGALGSLNSALQTLRGDAGPFTLSEFLEEIDEGQSDIVRVGEVLEGIVQIVTEFAPEIDQAALAMDLLSMEFEDIVSTAGLAGDRIKELQADIESGAKGIEEALIAVNEEFGTAFDLTDIRFDVGAIEAEIRRLDSVTATIGDLGVVAGELFNARFIGEIEQGELMPQMTDILNATIGNAIQAAFQNMVVSAVSLSALQPLLDQFSQDLQALTLDRTLSPADFAARAADLRTAMLPAMEDLGAMLGVAEEQAILIFEALGLPMGPAQELTEEAEATADNYAEVLETVQALAETMRGVGSPSEQLQALATDLEDARASLAELETQGERSDVELAELATTLADLEASAAIAREALFAGFLEPAQAFAETNLAGLGGLAGEFETFGRTVSDIREPLIALRDSGTLTADELQILNDTLDDVTAASIAGSDAIRNNFLQPVVDFVSENLPSLQTLEGQLSTFDAQVDELRASLLEAGDAATVTGADFDASAAAGRIAIVEDALAEILGPVGDFIESGAPELNALEALNAERDEALAILEKNKASLAEWIDLEEGRLQITEAHAAQVADALEEVLRPVGDFIEAGKTELSAFEQLANERDAALKVLNDNADSLGVWIDLVEGARQVNESFTNQMEGLKDAFIAADIQPFIDAGLKTSGALIDLRREFDDVTASIDELVRETGDTARGIDLMGDALASFNAQVDDLRRDLLAPFDAVLGVGGGGGAVDIAGATTFEELEFLRDEELANIADRLADAIDAAGESADAYIDSQRDLEDLQTDAVRDSYRLQRDSYNATISDFEELIRLRGQEDDLIRGLADGLRGLADSLRDLADDILLGDLSPEKPLEKLGEGLAQFREAFAAQDFDRLQELANPLLQLAEAQFTTADQDFGSIFDEVQNTLRAAADIADAQASEFDIEMEAIDEQTDLLAEIAALEAKLGVNSDTTVAQLDALLAAQESSLAALDPAEQTELDAIADAIAAAIAGREGERDNDILAAEDAAQSERTALRTALAAKFDELAGIEAAISVDLQKEIREGFETLTTLTDAQKTELAGKLQTVADGIAPLSPAIADIISGLAADLLANGFADLRGAADMAFTELINIKTEAGEIDPAIIAALDFMRAELITSGFAALADDLLGAGSATFSTLADLLGDNELGAKFTALAAALEAGGFKTLGDLLGTLDTTLTADVRTKLVDELGNLETELGVDFTQLKDDLLDATSGILSLETVLDAIDTGLGPEADLATKLGLIDTALGDNLPQDIRDALDTLREGLVADGIGESEGTLDIFGLLADEMAADMGLTLEAFNDLGVADMTRVLANQAQASLHAFADIYARQLEIAGRIGDSSSDTGSVQARLATLQGTVGFTTGAGDMQSRLVQVVQQLEAANPELDRIYARQLAMGGLIGDSSSASASVQGRMATLQNSIGFGVGSGDLQNRLENLRQSIGYGVGSGSVQEILTKGFSDVVTAVNGNPGALSSGLTNPLAHLSSDGISTGDGSGAVSTAGAVSVTIPLQIVTPDGTVLKETVLKDIRTQSKAGKILIHVDGVGTY